MSHLKETPHKCTTCGKDFKYKQSLTTHLRVHTGELPYKCSLCEKSFRSSSGLRIHIGTHSMETPYKCSICLKAFKQKRNLNAHLIVHSEERPHMCSVCGMKFKDRSSWRKHLRIHTGERPHVCPECQKSFHQRHTLSSHMRNVHKINGTSRNARNITYSNEIMSQSYPAYDKTKEKSTSTDTLHKCFICFKNFKQRKSLRSHFNVHADDFPCICSVCGNGFKGRSNWIEHLKTHGDHPFICSDCQKPSNQSTTLSINMEFCKSQFDSHGSNVEDPNEIDYSLIPASNVTEGESSSTPESASMPPGFTSSESPFVIHIKIEEDIASP